MAVDEQRERAELEAILRECQEPPSQRWALIAGLVGAFAAGGVVFLAVARLGALRGWAGGLLAVAVLALLFGTRRVMRGRERAGRGRERDDRDEGDDRDDRDDRDAL
jgi:hypothetical protein